MNAPTAPVAVSPVPSTWTTGSTEVFKTGTWRAALPHHVKAPSPCHQACPVNGDIAEWITRASQKDFHGAWQVLVRHNPFPAIAGRICHHPCESACNRAGYDDPLSICKLERHVGDEAITQAWPFDPPAQERAGHVGIIGAGPAGLSAAYQLRRRGWRVTIYESSAHAGGLMRHGIPAYRLARDVLDAEIARIVALGVQIRYGAAIASPQQLQELRDQHDAVLISTGAADVKRLPGLDYGAPWVMDGAAYLAAANAGLAPSLGASVLVIGGGSAAFDAARSACRAGHAVTILALEPEHALPAQREEVEEARAEGITIVAGAMLRTAVAAKQGVRFDCVRIDLEPGARGTAPQITPVDGSEFELRADAVLTSIGQDPDLAPFGGALARHGGLLAIDARGATSSAGIWAGGDIASQARFVTEAVGMGERAALAIHRHLLHDETGIDAPEASAVDLPRIATWYHAHAGRAASPLRDAQVRRRDSAEVQLGLEFDQALAEAQRCFSCGSCTHCDNCVVVCPDMAVRRAPDGDYEVLDDYCKGCGLCVRECPSGSMLMVEEQR